MLTGLRHRQVAFCQFCGRRVNGPCVYLCVHCACACVRVQGREGCPGKEGGGPAPALQPAQPRGPTLAAGRAVCHVLDCFRNSQEINLGGWEGASVYPRCAEVTQSESTSGLRPHCQPAGRGWGSGAEGGFQGKGDSIPSTAGAHTRRQEPDRWAAGKSLGRTRTPERVWKGSHSSR